MIAQTHLHNRLSCFLLGVFRQILITVKISNNHRQFPLKMLQTLKMILLRVLSCDYGNVFGDKSPINQSS